MFKKYSIGISKNTKVSSIQAFNDYENKKDKDCGMARTGSKNNLGLEGT